MPPPPNAGPAPGSPSLMRTSAPLALIGLAGIVLVVAFAPESLRPPLLVAIVAGVALRVVYDLLQRARQRDLASIASALGDTPGATTPASASELISLARARDGALRAQLERLVQQRRGLREVLDGVGAPVLALDSVGRIRFANRPAHQLLGARRETMVGTEIDDVLPHRQVLDLVERVRRGDELPRPRIRLSVGDVTRVMEVVAGPVRLGPVRGLAGQNDDGEPDEHGVALTLRDVTELDQAVQLKSDFAANASHELRTPVASIRGAAETLATLPEDPQMVARLVSMVENNARRLEEMVSDLLDLSRLESPDQRPTVEPVDLHAMAGELRDMFTDRLGEQGLSLEFDIAPGLERLISDPSLVELILRNLIDNACKHARDNTIVRVVARLADIRPSPDLPTPLVVDEARPMLGMRVRVIDEGTGIPLRDQRRIFERFYQVDPARAGGQRRRGTGLGLAIVKHAARRLGGGVGVESVWQQGTTMIVELPACVPTPGDETLAALEGTPDDQPIVQQTPSSDTSGDAESRSADR
ncbi:MAG: ATP-binding protein [Planctomycetota bacterium]